MQNVIMDQVSTVVQRLADFDQSAINLRDWQQHITVLWQQRERLTIEHEKNLHREQLRDAKLVSDKPGLDQGYSSHV
jgi:hypothetical protein